MRELESRRITAGDLVVMIPPLIFRWLIAILTALLAFVNAIGPD